MFFSTSYNDEHGLGYLGDAISSGQSLYWAGTVNNVVGTWARAAADFQSKVRGEGFGSTFEINEGSNSLAVNVTAPGDFGDANDVKAILDGIANEAGFRLRASMIRAGARPLATETPSPWLNPLSNAGDFWGSEISSGADSLAKGLGLEGGSNLVTIGLLALGALFVWKVIGR